MVYKSSMNGRNISINGGEVGGVTTDNAVVRWDGTTGEFVQNSGVTLSDEASNTYTFTSPSNKNMRFTAAGTGQVQCWDSPCVVNSTFLNGLGVTLLYADIATARIGIGTSAPGYLVHLYIPQGIGADAICRMETVNDANAANLQMAAGEGANISNFSLGAVSKLISPNFIAIDQNSSTILYGCSASANGGKFVIGNSFSAPTYRHTVLSTDGVLGNGSYDDGLIVNLLQTSTGDFVAKGDTDANLFIVDASADKAGVGKIPTVKLDVEGIVGVKAGLSSSVAKAGGALFDHFASVGNVGTGEDDLYSDTLSANVFGTNGDKVYTEEPYTFTLVSSATATRQIRAYVAGTLVADSGALTFSSGGSATLWMSIIRESSSVLRVSTELVVTGITLQSIVTYTRITGLTLSNTQIVKTTGEAAGVGAATDDIVNTMASLAWLSAA